MNPIEILSINIGKPQLVPYKNKEVVTGINKQSTDAALFLSWENFEGDGQADLVHHGGREKAVCVYPFEHYAYWVNELKQPMVYGAFGENLTIRGLVETEVCIGDQFELGEAIVEVSQPRQPCFKLSVKYDRPDMPLKVQESGYTGFYFRVVQEGHVAKTDILKRVLRHPHGITVAYANRIMHQEKDNVAGIRKLLEVQELSVSWRATFVKRLEGQETDTRERLTGTTPNTTSNPTSGGAAD
ncbi:cytoplasmic protein [Paenibacillus pectinilyticus]|uniref:Cytoplasmic protein n=1 Tax=Paenibacillus pectinilyticus TaxID=512399 RepID=A0A1C1A5Q4_9BACL|nr:MOSC domain-containing protein [Paenibacillus pectinilyticus]OCT15900.1 cytoplasmic protein [Paenibacillus pectinilyticus]